MEFLWPILAKIELTCQQTHVSGAHPSSGVPERMTGGWWGGLAMSYVMNVLSVLILMLIAYQVNRVMPVTCHLSVPAHTPKILVSLNILTIFVVVKLISILFTWPQVLLKNFICILAMRIQVNTSYTKFGVSSCFSVIRKYDIAKKSTSLIHGTVVQQCHFFVSDPVELWVC